MLKKGAVIVVPGVKSLSNWPMPIRSAVYFVCSTLGLKPVYEDHAKIWEGKIVPSKGLKFNKL